MKKRIRQLVAFAAITAMCASLVSCGKKGDYVHGKKGYYSQLDNGITTEVTKQGSGGCWAHACTTSILTASQICEGKVPDLVPYDIMKDTYQGHDGGEGWHYDYDVNVTGGGGIVVIDGLSNGIGEDGYVLVEAPFFGWPDQNDVPGNHATKEEIQEIIRTKGAVTCALSFANANFYGMDHGYLTLYDDPSNHHELHHEVCLVGWDDNFPKEYFGAEYRKELPKSNGAWLAKDSQGADYGNDGYFWISYESNMMYDCLLHISDKYSQVLSYDGGCMDTLDLPGDNIAANVFHQKGKLAAVGTQVGLIGIMGRENVYDRDLTTIKIEIRDASMNEVLAKKEVSFDFPGYYVVELDSPIEVEDYSIVITYSAHIPLESEMLESHRDIYYVSGIEEGQSFVFKDGQWIDLASADAKDIFGLEDTPNNVCIKALYVD